MLLVFEGADAKKKKKNPVTDLLLLQQLGDAEDLPEMLRKEPRSPDSPVSGWPGPHGVVTPDCLLEQTLHCRAASLGASQHIRLHTRSGRPPVAPPLPWPSPSLSMLSGEKCPPRSLPDPGTKAGPSPHTLPGPLPFSGPA